MKSHNEIEGVVSRMKFLRSDTVYKGMAWPLEQFIQFNGGGRGDGTVANRLVDLLVGS